MQAIFKALSVCPFKYQILIPVVFYVMGSIFWICINEVKLRKRDKRIALLQEDLEKCYDSRIKEIEKDNHNKK